MSNFILRLAQRAVGTVRDPVLQPRREPIFAPDITAPGARVLLAGLPEPLTTAQPADYAPTPDPSSITQAAGDRGQNQVEASASTPVTSNADSSSTLPRSVRPAASARRAGRIGHDPAGEGLEHLVQADVEQVSETAPVAGLSPRRDATQADSHTEQRAGSAQPDPATHQTLSPPAQAIEPAVIDHSPVQILPAVPPPPDWLDRLPAEPARAEPDEPAIRVQIGSVRVESQAPAPQRPAHRAEGFERYASLREYRPDDPF